MKRAILRNTLEKKNKEAFLVHAADEVQASALESLLNAYNIPVLKKRRQAGGYLNITTGMNIYGVDIYVPSLLHRDASAIISNWNSTDNSQDAEFLNETENLRKKRLIRIWIIVGMFYLPVVIWFFYRLFVK